MTKFLENSLLNPNTRYQLLATVIVNIITFGHGFGVGWLSPTLTKIKDPETPLSFQVGIAEVSWLGSMLGLGYLGGNLTMVIFLERLGRKFCIYLLAGPYACIWILTYCATNVGYLYAARFFCGFTAGAAYLVIPIYISEIAYSRIRGRLTTMMLLSVNIGTLVGYILSTYLDYHVVPFVGVSLPIIYFIASLFLPESAPYLLRQSRVTAAEESFKYYTNHKHGINTEFEELRLAIDAQTKENSTTISYKDLITKPVLKAFAAAIVLSAGYQFSGVFSFINYMSDIFKESGSVLDVNSSTIIIGAVQILGSYTSTIFVDTLGRRILMLISTLGTSLGCIVFGFFTYFAQQYDLSDFNWLPLVLMIIIIYLANIGLIGAFFIVLVELFPVKIRSVATSISIVILSALIFCTLKLFPLLMHYFGISVTMWFSAASSFLTFVYFLLFLQETKGKSMVQD